MRVGHCDAMLGFLMEAMMFGHSSVHFQLNWVKERIDEMDAALASLEKSARKARSRSGSDASRLVGELRKRRARFAAIVKKQAKANDAAWQRSRTLLEAEWKTFEAEATRQFKTAARQAEQKALFRRASGVQAKAWREAVARLQDVAGALLPARRTRLSIAVRQMKAEAAKAQARLRKLAGAGSVSWSAMHKALTASRKAFDRANRKAGHAIRRAVD